MVVYGGPEITTSGLVLHLDAGNSKSYPGTGTTWTDLSGNGNNGTLTNGPTFSSNNKGYITFDGTNDFANCGDQSLFKISTSLSLEAFFYVSTYVNWAGIIGKSTQPKGVYVMQLSHTAQKIRFSHNSVGPTYAVNIIDGNYTVTTGIWIHSIITYDGANVRFYVNGQLDKTQALVTTFDTGNGYPVTIGQDPPGGNEFFNGRIAVTRIYNRTLSASEILNNYNALKGRYGL